MKKSLLILSLTLIASCASDPYKLTSKAKEVEVLDRKPKGNKCEVVAKVKGFHDQGSESMAINMARNKAASEGADSIYIDEAVPNGSKRHISATAYFCNE